MEVAQKKSLVLGTENIPWAIVISQTSNIHTQSLLSNWRSCTDSFPYSTMHAVFVIIHKNILVSDVLPWKPPVSTVGEWDNLKVNASLIRYCTAILLRDNGCFYLSALRNEKHSYEGCRNLDSNWWWKPENCADNLPIYVVQNELNNDPFLFAVIRSIHITHVMLYCLPFSPSRIPVSDRSSG